MTGDLFFDEKKDRDERFECFFSAMLKLGSFPNSPLLKLFDVTYQKIEDPEIEKWTIMKKLKEQGWVSG